MDFHLERTLRLNIEPTKRLYKWSISEIDPEGRRLAPDYVPWGWALYFTATSCVLHDSVDIRAPFRIASSRASQTTATAEGRSGRIERHQTIRARMRPGVAKDANSYSRQTTYSMFGTDRPIEHFELCISALSSTSTEEYCTAWGCPSYTTDIDFRDERMVDTLTFSMWVTPEAFLRYATKVLAGHVDELILRVSQVDGFYAEWSPSISTRDVKVLTSEKEHGAELAPTDEFEPLRLGDVGEAALYLRRKLTFSEAAPTDRPLEDDEPTSRRDAPPPQPPVDPHVITALRSLRRIAMFSAWALGLILLALLLRR